MKRKRNLGLALVLVAVLWSNVVFGQSVEVIGDLQLVNPELSVPGRICFGDGSCQDKACYGTVTSVTAADGLWRSIVGTTVTLGVNFGGTGSAITAARSDHTHNYDSNYVNATGDTMTGKLTLQGGLAVTAGGFSVGTATQPDLFYIQKNVQGLSYALKLDNQNATINGTTTGILFSTGGGGETNGKGALVYETTSTYNRGSFHFLQEPTANFLTPTLDNAVLTIRNNGNVGVGTRTPGQKLDVNGVTQVRGTLSFADAGGTAYPGNWIGMANNIEGTTQWLHIGGITDAGLRRIALFGDKVYFNGHVGINKQPTERLDVEGNVKITGSGNGVIFPDGSKQTTATTGFGRANFDSGWVDIAPGQQYTLGHGLGGDVDKYLVDLRFKGQNFGITNKGIGGYQQAGNWLGGYYHDLTTGQITVVRHSSDDAISQFRIRIWVYN